MSGEDARPAGRGVSDTSSEGDLSRRLDSLGAELAARRPAASAKPGSSAGRADPSGLAKALRVSSEFIAGIIVGGGIGWVFDKGLGTSPWGLIVFLLVGFAAGTYNVIRSAGLSERP